MSKTLTDLTPKQIVEMLNRFVIGQSQAKEYVAKALRDRWRRMQTEEPMRSEIEPKNILMIGPTGVGKTEIARRLAKITSSPFIKVEATKFTEVGYMGRDVEQIIRDLLDSTLAKMKAEAKKALLDDLVPAAVEQLLDTLVGANAGEATRKKFRDDLAKGKLDDREVDVQVIQPMEVQGTQLPEMLTKMMGRKKTKKMKVQEALKFFQSEEASKEFEDSQIVQEAIQEVEQKGIVFIDEIDKICEDNERIQKGSVSREGVQRDLLPLIEGTEVSTKHGLIKTHHILFIGSGAFQLARKEDLIPELQGRFPVVVKMESLTKEDFIAILSHKESSLMKQYQEMMKTEDIELEFTEDGVELIAEVAAEANYNEEDIGARRLQGLMEKFTHTIGFDIEEFRGKKVVIDRKFVEKQRGEYKGHDARASIL